MFEKIGLNGSSVLRPDNLLTLASRFSNASASMGKIWQATAREHDSLQPCFFHSHVTLEDIAAVPTSSFWGVQILNKVLFSSEVLRWG